VGLSSLARTVQEARSRLGFIHRRRGGRR
jgi:hypothetical protein